MNDSSTAPAIFRLRDRIGRGRYLAWNFVFTILLLLGTVPLMMVAGEAAATWLSALCSAAVGMYLGVRRLHDLGRSGWIALGLLVPVLNLAIGLWLLCAPGDPEANRFGQAPPPNTRAVIVLAWAVPVVFVAGVLAAVGLAPHKSSFERARDEMEQAI